MKDMFFLNVDSTTTPPPDMRDYEGDFGDVRFDNVELLDETVESFRELGWEIKQKTEDGKILYSGFKKCVFLRRGRGIIGQIRS